MTQRFSKEELIELSNANIDKFKANRKKKVFMMLGLSCATVGIVGAARLMGLDQEAMNAVAAAATIAESAVLGATVPKFILSCVTTKTAKQVLEKYENGEFDDEFYYKEVLEPAMKMAGTIREELESEINSKKGMGM